MEDLTWKRMRLTGYCVQKSEDTGHSPVGTREGAKEKEATTGEKRCCWKDEPLLIEAKERELPKGESALQQQVPDSGEHKKVWGSTYNLAILVAHRYGQQIILAPWQSNGLAKFGLPSAHFTLWEVAMVTSTGRCVEVTICDQRWEHMLSIPPVPGTFSLSRCCSLPLFTEVWAADPPMPKGNWNEVWNEKHTTFIFHFIPDNQITKTARMRFMWHTASSLPMT